MTHNDKLIIFAAIIAVAVMAWIVLGVPAFLPMVELQD